MARVSYIEEKDHPELAELIGKVRAGRRGEGSSEPTATISSTALTYRPSATIR